MAGRLLTIIIAIIAGFAGAFGYNKFFAGESASTGSAGGSSEADIRAFLKENPLEIYNSVIAGQGELQKQKDRAAKEAVKSNLSELEGGNSPVFGNPKGKNIVVKFSDYNCGYCKKAGAVVAKLAEKRDDIKVVVKDYPILGSGSTIASKAALAVHDKFADKYEEFHFALLKTGGRTLEGVLVAADKVGIDRGELKAIYNDSKYQDQLNENLRLGQLIGVNGTPAFVVNGEFVPGYLDENRMADLLD